MKNNNWVYKVFLFTFILAIVFSGVSNLIANNLNIIFLIIILLIVIFIGVIFDMVGVSILTGDEANFHAASTSRVKGARETVYLIKNASKISSICNDVIGDICGIVSGSLGAVLSIYISSKYKIDLTLLSILIAAIISSLTVGTKAIGKSIAARKCNDINNLIGKIIYTFKFKKK